MELNPEEANYFRTKQRQVTETHELGGAQNVYEQGALGRQYGRGVNDLAYKYGRMRESMPWQYGAKGLLNSGIYQKGLYDLGQEGWLRPLGDMAGQYQDQLGSYQLAQQQMDRVKGSSLSDLEEQKAARIAAVASSLRGANL